MSNTPTDISHDRGEPRTEPLPAVPLPAAPAPLAGLAAGATGAVLLVVGVWGLHVLCPAGGFTVSPGSVVLLLTAFSALGKGIALLQRALAPITAAAAAAVSGVPSLARAVVAIVIGAAGIWWVMRGYAAMWWVHTTGAPGGRTLVSALVQVTLIAVAGALLFGGAKSLAGLVLMTPDAYHHRSAALTGRARRDRWTSWWSSRPGLGLMLLAGAAALVTLSGYIVPRVTGWLLGGDRLAALAAIVALLVAGLLANTWWWGGLSGWWVWAHRPHTPGGGATPMGQLHAGAAVVALLWFSATAFGLAVPDSYTGPGAMPRARADCPPDCGGTGGSNSFGPNPSQLQPPQMPDPPGQYQGGANSGYPSLDQNNGISLYNPATDPSSNPAQGGYPQQGQPGPPANGVQPPNYDAPPPPQASAPPQAPAGPQQGAAQQPAQAPQQPGQQAPAEPQQAAVPQQVPGQQGPQQPAQQPAQQPQGQPHTSQQNQPAQQQPQKPAPTKEPDNAPIDPTDLAAAATRRGSQQAGQQAAQTAGQQATQQATQQSTQTAQQGTQQVAEKAGEKGSHESTNTSAGLAQGVIKSGQAASSQAEGVSKGIENAATKGAKYGYEVSEDVLKGAETVGKFAKRAGLAGDALSAAVDIAAGKPPVESISKAAFSAGVGYAGGALGASLGALAGPLAPVAIPALATLGSVGGSLIGEKIGEAVAPAISSAISAVSSWFS